MCERKLRGRKRIVARNFLLLFAVLLFAVINCLAQADGVAGIESATDLLNDYFEAGVTLLYIIGAVVGLIGAVKVYNKWSSGDQDTSKAAASWFGACIFLVIVATALRSFFGIG
ncbi:DUF4134 domain-containing protein [Chitinophaga cymbidii]|uniref:Conjugal transfer protein n=1 Tax=Chitinophaga cymbidii TaxID=1096750 RepID=A0A512RFL7_9BACT|nr:DUF4134 domain-containing protein [Chitinophaga cymbidii]GEP94503.1 conjugal transfer protein [Chitinophaga cymbidii]